MKRKVEAGKENGVMKFKKKKKDEKPILTKEERERRKTSYCRPPTSEELSELKENENLYKNNLFRMQIDYLLEEVKLKEKVVAKLNDVLHSLNRHLTEISNTGKERQLADSKCCRKGVAFPLPDLIPRSQLKGKFKFVPPTEVKVIGSYLLKTLTKPKISVDVAVEIPQNQTFFRSNKIRTTKYGKSHHPVLVQSAEPLFQMITKTLTSLEEFKAKIETWVAENTKCFRICSDWTKFHLELVQSMVVFKNNVYPENFVNNCFKAFLGNKHRIQGKLEVFQPRDCINYRYHYKRAYYLTWLASSLKLWVHTEQLQFVTKHDMYKPILQIKLKGKIGKKFHIHLYPSIPAAVFKQNRFAPLKNNIRSNWYEGLDAAAIEEIEFATPQYNSSVLSDMLYEAHLHALYTAIKDCPGIKDAICLFKVWLEQRSFKGEYSFNGFIGSMLTVYLLMKRKISVHMSSYQIFRLLLNYLATSDLSKDGISLCNDQDDCVPMRDFHATFDVVFVDRSGYLNLAAAVDLVSYQMIRKQAKMSMEMLDNMVINSFECLFIKRHHFLQAVDHSFRLSALDNFTEKIKKEEDNKLKLMDYGGDWTRCVASFVYSILEKGLNNRVNSIVLKPQENTVWDVTTEPSDIKKHTTWFGLCLNTDHCEEMLVMGPPAELPEAKSFRKLWGEKSELRRFQDGSINEAVLFKCDSMSERKLITKRIVHHLLKLHCGIPETSILYHAEETDSMLRLKYQAPADSRVKYILGCGEEENVHFIKTFDSLRKEMQALNDLPLTINSIQGIDPAFRMTEVVAPRQYQSKATSDSSKNFLVPKSGKCPTWCPYYRANIQFETSGKWPDDIEAIQHIKTAFHIKLSQCIRSQLRHPSVATPTFVDVIKNGYVFRLSVAHYREMVLYKETVTTGMLKKEYESSAKMLDLEIVKRPLHTSLIHGLSSRFHSYSPTVRLCKKWLASQMLSDYFEEEAVELLVANLFINPQPLETPSSHLSGFIRFLNHMAKFDWENQPLVVNINDDIKDEVYYSIEEHFSNHRAQLPPMFIATSYDRDVSVWTRHNPSNQIIRRASMLAAEALNLIEENQNNLNQTIMHQLFRPCLDDFHVIIELNRKFVPLNYASHDTTHLTKPVQLKENISHLVLPVAGFDPVRHYINELKDAFSDIALFFHNRYGGFQVGVVWLKEAHISQPFKILRSQYKSIVQTPVSSKKKGSITAGVTVKPNIAGIISDFRVMGRDLVVNVIENS